MKNKLLYIFLLIFSISSYGQQKWQIKVDGGYSIPVSKYAKVDVSQTFSFIDGSPLAEFFDKEGHGFAEISNYYNIAVKRKLLNNKLIVSAGFGQGTNPVNTTEISNYYTDFLDDIFYYVFEQDHFNITYGFLSAGYNHQISILNFTFEPLMGFSSMRYPDYKMTGYLDATDEYRIEAIHRGPKEDISSLLIGIQSAIDVILLNRLLLGISIRYLSANYGYVIEPEVGGIDPRERNDTVNYRVFNVGISLGILF